VCRPQLLRDPFPVRIRCSHTASRDLIVHTSKYNIVTNLC
jgi:hypothetical protein